MVISKLYKNKDCYVHLHAELSYHAVFLQEKIEMDKEILAHGIYGRMLDIQTLKRVVEDLLADDRITKESSIILDFENINSAQPNLFNLLSELNRSVKHLFVLNVSKILANELGLEWLLDKRPERFFEWLCLNPRVRKVPIDDKNKFIQDEIAKVLKEVTIPYLDEEGLPISHNAVYVSKFIHVRRLILNNKRIFLFLVYLLAEKMTQRTADRIWRVSKDEQVVLYSQNLNSSLIATYLGQFLAKNVIFIDHVGPINKVYGGLSNKIRRNSNYLVVSDIVCLGTEVKVAKSLIEFSGARYVGNVSLFRFRTVRKPKGATSLYNDTECVFEMSKDMNPLDLSVYTEFEYHG